ncbi:MAG: hypothetical protein COT06_03705 [Syntrophobacteraceae bacterium CG07_land_8_20_14_0_80_61_8]|nr:MAG: hypothetical protein COT06_03705 [Syntrophobacteraceae bacterium CG07_land_8_20_14_0_80_61_8]
MSGSPGNKAADTGADGAGDGIGVGDTGVGARDPFGRAHPAARQGGAGVNHLSRLRDVALRKDAGKS